MADIGTVEPIEAKGPPNDGKNLLALLAAFAMTFPWVIARYGGFHLGVGWEVLLTGLTILGAAFLISWAAELAQFDVSRSLAMAVLSLIAVLPEYAVDLYLAWKAARNSAYIDLIAANMTGANRLLVGIGWSSTMLVGWWALRRRTRESRKSPDLEGNALRLDRSLAIETLFLFLATLWSFVIVLKAQISLGDMLLLVLLYGGYVVCAVRAPHVEPEPVGAVEMIARLPTRWRRLAFLLLFGYGGFAILIATEPFAEGLKTLGQQLGISAFIMLQWIAPLASESPEMIVILYFAARGLTTASLTAIISSKINQWTLLIGTIPLIFSISAGRLTSVPLNPLPREEVFLTAAQSLFAFAIIGNRWFSTWEAALLFGLFIVQLAIPIVWVRYLFSGIYLVLAFYWIVRYRREMLTNWHDFVALVFKARGAVEEAGKKPLRELGLPEN